MRYVAATDFAIARAMESGDLKVVVRFNKRLEANFYHIEDDCGTIEVALTLQEANDRIKAVNKMGWAVDRSHLEDLGVVFQI
jgi:hypothetical protein